MDQVTPPVVQTDHESDAPAPTTDRPVVPPTVFRITPLPPDIVQRMSDGFKYGKAAVYRHQPRSSAADRD